MESCLAKKYHIDFIIPEPSATQLIVQFLEHSGLVNNNVVCNLSRDEKDEN